MDRTDRAIIAQLVADARLTNTELADRVGLTPAPCLRRVRQLERSGVIAGYHARIDPTAAGRAFEVIVNVDLAVHQREVTAHFESTVAGFSEVVEFRRMFGLRDYFLRVATPDLHAFEDFVTNKLEVIPGIGKVESHLTMKVITPDR